MNQFIAFHMGYANKIIANIKGTTNCDHNRIQSISVNRITFQGSLPQLPEKSIKRNFPSKIVISSWKSWKF